MSEFVKEVNESNFERDVPQSDQPVLVDFWAAWCGPCKAMEPVVERLAERFAGRAEVVKVNIDESRELAGECGVRGVPTFLLFVRGRAVERVVGASGEQTLAALIEQNISQLQPTL